MRVEHSDDCEWLAGIVVNCKCPKPLTPYTRPVAYLDCVAAQFRKIPPEHLAAELEGVARVLMALAQEARRYAPGSS